MIEQANMSDENELTSAEIQEILEAQPAKKERKKRDAKKADIEKVIEPEIAEQPEEIEEPALNYTALRMLRDFSFQMGMPARPYIFVTINLKEGQVVTDQSFFPYITEHDNFYDWIE